MTPIDTATTSAARAADSPATTEPRPGPFRIVVQRMPRPSSIGIVVSALVLLTVVGWAVFPALFAPTDPLAGTPADRFTEPGGAYPFGSDNLGRDLYSRIVHGASLSLRSAALAVAFGIVGGTLLGALAGTIGGLVDALVMRIVDVLLAVPGLLLSLLIVTVLSFDALSVALAVGVGSVAGFARLARTEVIRVNGFAFVEAARAAGLGWSAVVVRHIVPNVLRPLLAFATVEFAGAILSISALTFLGFGAQPPTPEWGALVSDGRDFLATAWWLTAIPGLVIVVTVVSVNTIGRALSGR